MQGRRTSVGHSIACQRVMLTRTNFMHDVPHTLLRPTLLAQLLVRLSAIERSTVD